MSYTTWEKYKGFKEFMEPIETIENYLESVLIERAGEGEYNSQFAQFILNVNYGRVPKSKSEQIIKGNIVNEEDFIQD